MYTRETSTTTYTTDKTHRNRGRRWALLFGRIDKVGRAPLSRGGRRRRVGSHATLLTLVVAGLVVFAPASATADSVPQGCRGLAQALSERSATDPATARLVSQYIDKCGPLAENLCRPPISQGGEGLPVFKPSLSVAGSGEMGEVTFGLFKTTSFVLTNTRCGQEPLTLNLGVSGAAFHIKETDCRATLPSSASCTVTVIFVPPAGSTYDGSFTAETNAPDSPTTVGLSGTGICQVHTNGLGQTFIYCALLGQPGHPATYTQEMAFRAAYSWIGGWGAISQGSCFGGQFLMRAGAGGIAVWQWSGSFAGYVHLEFSNEPVCPGGGDPIWY